MTKNDSQMKQYDHQELQIKLIIVFSILLIAAFGGIIRIAFFTEYKYATLKMMLNGTAVTPIQFRILGAWIIKILWQWTGFDLIQIVRIYESLVLAFSIWMIYQYGKATGLPGNVSVVTAMSLFYLYPFYFIYEPLGRFYYPGDSLSIFFMALGLWLLVKEYFLAFAFTFLGGILCRESLVLLLPLFLVYNWKRLSIRYIVFWIFTYIVLFIAAKFFLFALFGTNWGAGSFSLDHDIFHKGLPHSLETSRVFVNFRFLLSPMGLILFLSYGGFLWLPMLTGFRAITNTFVKQSTLMIPLSLFILFFVGNYNEPRIFCDMAPVVLVTASHALVGITKSSRVRENS
jgi:hypothetical protein